MIASFRRDTPTPERSDSLSACPFPASRCGRKRWKAKEGIKPPATYSPLGMRRPPPGASPFAEEKTAREFFQNLRRTPCKNHPATGTTESNRPGDLTTASSPEMPGGPHRCLMSVWPGNLPPSRTRFQCRPPDSHRDLVIRVEVTLTETTTGKPAGERRERNFSRAALTPRRLTSSLVSTLQLYHNRKVVKVKGLRRFLAGKVSALSLPPLLPSL